MASAPTAPPHAELESDTAAIMGDTKPGEAGGAAASDTGKSRYINVKAWSAKRMLRTLRLLNLLNGVALVVCGFLLILLGTVTFSVGVLLAATYCALFGLILCCAELKISNLQPLLERNFGFMFSFVGRAVFIFFSGTMCFALGSWIGYLVGALTIANGLFNGYVLRVHPMFATGALRRTANPFTAYTGGEKEAMAFLKANPQLAAKAGASVAAFAASTPGLTQTAMTAMAGGGAQPAGEDPFLYPSPTARCRASLTSDDLPPAAAPVATTPCAAPPSAPPPPVAATDDTASVDDFFSAVPTGADAFRSPVMAHSADDGGNSQPDLL